MRVHLLHLDDSLMQQPGLMRTCRAARARELDARDAAARVRLWGTHRGLATLRRRIGGGFGAPVEGTVSFIGSGDFHHVSALLLERAAAASGRPFSVVHFDNHPDWVKFKGGLHCGSWVNAALAMPAVTKIITVGICSEDLAAIDRKCGAADAIAAGRLEIMAYDHPDVTVRRRYPANPSFTQDGNVVQWRQLKDETQASFVDKLSARIPAGDVYITVDKDAFPAAETSTNWDHGRMPLAWALAAIAAIGQGHRIIGADVTGDYARSHFSGPAWQRWLKRAEIVLDQPRRRPDVQVAANLNERANLALLGVLKDAMR